MMYKFTYILTIILFFITATVLADNSLKESPTKNEVNLIVEIYHCPTCGFESIANRVAKEVNAEFGVEATLIKGEIGRFDIYVNDELIYSKVEVGRLPNSGEIAQIINNYLNKN